MAYTIDRRRRGTFKENKAKLKRILRRLEAAGHDGRKLADEDLVWLTNDEWRIIEESGDLGFDLICQKLKTAKTELAKAREARDAAAKQQVWNKLETDLRVVHVDASMKQGFKKHEIKEAKVIAQTKKIYGGYEKSIALVLTDDLNKGVRKDGTPNLETYKNVLTIRIILAAAKATKLPYNIYVVEANSLRFRQNTSKPSPWPHPKSNFEKICRIVLIEQLKDIKPVAIFLHSSPARGMFKVKVGKPVFAGRTHLGLEKVGGLDEVAEARGGPILVEGFDHMAQARFFKAFWWWGKIAVELARK